MVSPLSIGARLIFCVLVIHAGDAFSGSSERDWNLQTSLEMRRIVYSQFEASTQPFGFDDRGRSEAPIAWAPSGKYFFFVTRNGNVEHDCTQYKLMVHSTFQLRQAVQRSKLSVPDPVASASLCASHPSGDTSETIYFGISRAKWTGPSVITFMGTEGSGPRGVYQLDVTHNRLLRLTAPDANVVTYAIRDSTIVYSARVPNPPVGFRYPATVLSAETLEDIVLGASSSFDIHVVRRGQGDEVVDRARYLGVAAERLSESIWISPDERWAVLEYAPAAAEAPPEWQSYPGKPTGQNQKSTRPMLVDLTRQTARPLLSSPAGDATQAGDPTLFYERWRPFKALWSNDSRRVILLNVALPIEPGQSEQARASAIVEFRMDAQAWRVVDSAMPPPRGSNCERQNDCAPVAFDVAWGTRDPKALAVTYFSDISSNVVGSRRYLRRDNQWVGEWIRNDATVGSRETIEHGHRGAAVYAIESSTQPPDILMNVAGVPVSLLVADSALEKRRWIRASDVFWLEEDGRQGRGRLTLPRNAGAAPLPLVILPYRIDTESFSPDGAMPFAYPLQSLVNRGCAVLETSLAQSDYRESLERDPSLRGSLESKRFEAAVQSLVAKGKVDPVRIGLIGFSQGAYTINSIITHPGQFVPRSAVIVDPSPDTYFSYVYGARQSSEGRYPKPFIEGVNGGAFREHADTWLERSSGFNVNRVKTPTLFSFHGASRLLEAYEPFGQFRLNQIPGEILFFARGNHILETPAQLAASLSATLDWTLFWLLGEQDADPSKREQYQRWTALRGH